MDINVYKYKFSYSIETFLSSVAEGVKLIKQNRIKEAMDFYKRALDMDPKYADGWFHVAEG